MPTPPNTATTNTPRIVANYHCKTGEGPLWHPRQRRVYWTDIPAGRMYWYSPETGEHRPCYEGRPVGGFTIQADDQLLLFRDRGNIVTWRADEEGGGEVTGTVIDEIEAERAARWNDVMADPEGRVFGGTMAGGKRTGRWYRIDTDLTATPLLENLGVPNGMGFSPNGRYLYFTHTSDNVIYRFEYDRDTGRLADQQVAVRVGDEQEGGHPDGMIVDSQGHLWSASWEGGGIYQYGPEGEFIGKIALPTARITSLTFTPPLERPTASTQPGDADATLPAPTTQPGDAAAQDAPLTQVYVTSATAGREDANEEAGALFTFTSDVPGQAEFRSRLGL